MSDHRHRAKYGRPRTVGFSECVNPDECVPEAHGGYVSLQQCSCGATRRIACNGPYREVGPWEEPHYSRVVLG
jgi:hypothetical protein